MLKKSALRLFRFLRTKPVPVNTREILALERTKLANERTLLSYIRSSLYLLLGGIGLLQLEDFKRIHWLGYVALIVCVIFLGIGIFRFVLLSRKLYKWNRVLYADTINRAIESSEEEITPKDKKEE